MSTIAASRSTSVHRRLLWVPSAVACILGVAACTTNQRGIDADGFNTHQQIVPLRLERKKASLFVETTICGKGPYTFLVDTGATVLAVTADVARDAGLKPDLHVKQMIVGSGGVAIEGSRTLVPKIEIPDLVATDVTAVIIPENVSATLRDAIHPRFGGVIGMNLFNGVLLEIDCENLKMTLKPRRLAPNKPFFAYQETPSVPVQIGREQYTLKIDTGTFFPCCLPK